MKKVISLFLIVIMIFSLCACSSDNNGNDTNSKGSNETASVNSNNTDNPTNNSAQIDLNKYVSVEFKEYNLTGRGSVKFDKEAFLLDHIKNVSFNEENLAVYEELYGNTDESAAKRILNYFSAKLEKNNKLSNGDTVQLVWEIDTHMINTYFKWDYTCSEQTFTVTGLKDAASFDPFEKLEIYFIGTAPYGKAEVYNYGTNYGRYGVTPAENLKNGDKVTVTFYCDDKSTMIEKYHMYPSAYEKIYVVSGLD